MLLQNVVVGKLSHINMRLVLILTTSTSIQKLEKYSNNLIQVFGVIYVKKTSNELDT